ncbi:hypothetical protein [Brevundimonas sp.]|uniref:hypothetical protein n=1 Tax=Brevundimonas sp. TaxID=1871086 RepID=UPI003B00FD3E
MTDDSLDFSQRDPSAGGGGFERQQQRKRPCSPAAAALRLRPTRPFFRRPAPGPTIP